MLEFPKSVLSSVHCLTLKMPRTKKKKNEFANSVDPEEMAHNELPHLDLHCLPSGLSFLSMILLGT